MSVQIDYNENEGFLIKTKEGSLSISPEELIDLVGKAEDSAKWYLNSLHNKKLLPDQLMFLIGCNMVKTIYMDCMGDKCSLTKSDMELFKITVILKDGTSKEYNHTVLLSNDQNEFDMQMEDVPRGVSLFFNWKCSDFLVRDVSIEGVGLLYTTRQRAGVVE